MGDWSRRSAVNQVSYGSRPANNGSTLRSLQQRDGSVWFRIPNCDSWSATLCLASRLNKLSFHSRGQLVAILEVSGKWYPVSRNSTGIRGFCASSMCTSTTHSD